MPHKRGMMVMGKLVPSGPAPAGGPIYGGHIQENGEHRCSLSTRYGFEGTRLEWAHLITPIRRSFREYQKGNAAAKPAMNFTNQLSSREWPAAVHQQHAVGTADPTQDGPSRNTGLACKADGYL